MTMGIEFPGEESPCHQPTAIKGAVELRQVEEHPGAVPVIDSV